VRRATAEELGVVDKLPAAAEGADAGGAEAPAEDPKITLWNCYSHKAATLGKDHRSYVYDAEHLTVEKNMVKQPTPPPLFVYEKALVITKPDEQIRTTVPANKTSSQFGKLLARRASTIRLISFDVHRARADFFAKVDIGKAPTELFDDADTFLKRAISDGFGTFQRPTREEARPRRHPHSARGAQPSCEAAGGDARPSRGAAHGRQLRVL
jgi:hypothetical protein